MVGHLKSRITLIATTATLEQEGVVASYFRAEQALMPFVMLTVRACLALAPVTNLTTVRNWTSPTARSAAFNVTVSGVKRSWIRWHVNSKGGLRNRVRQPTKRYLMIFCSFVLGSDLFVDQQEPVVLSDPRGRAAKGGTSTRSGCQRFRKLTFQGRFLVVGIWIQRNLTTIAPSSPPKAHTSNQGKTRHKGRRKGKAKRRRRGKAKRRRQGKAKRRRKGKPKRRRMEKAKRRKGKAKRRRTETVKKRRKIGARKRPKLKGSSQR
mmetsp:Transcript_22979/g.34084  ORF Transcript_22979/g.34084 Transcript_22979/m.34084 type:complete len:264 (+) Transcript_22979:1384-2175(+)